MKEVKEMNQHQQKVIYTIGHSNHDKDTFLNMLKQCEIEVLVDIRSFTHSQKHPQFEGEAMKEWLKEAGITYCQNRLLGGRRPESEKIGASLNEGWQNASFHHYADYTLSDDFKNGIKALTDIALDKRTAYMCAENHPARCHRLIISNFLVAHGWIVKHILLDHHGEIKLQTHQLGQWGAMPILEDDGEVVYPKKIE